jgi:hypothetical protein
VTIQSFHEKHRDKRTGRTKLIRSKSEVSPGRLMTDRLHVQEKHFRQYVRLRAKSVGTLKAGWLWAVDRFPGASKPPAWVARHSNHGTGRDNMRDNGTGFIEFTNPHQHAGRWKRVNDVVMRSREKGMLHELRGAIRKAAREYERRQTQ